MAGLFSWLWRKIGRVKQVSAQRPAVSEDGLLIVNRLSICEALALATDAARPMFFLAHARAGMTGRLARLARPVHFKIIGEDCVQAMCEWIVTRRQKGYAVCLCADGITDADLERVVRRTRSKATAAAALPYGRLALTRNFRHLAFTGADLTTGVCYGREIAPAEFTGARARRELMEALSRAAESHPALKTHLAEAVVRGLKKRLFGTVVIDTYVHGKKISGGMLLALAWLLAEKLEALTEEERVGVVLPPGARR